MDKFIVNQDVITSSQIKMNLIQCFQ